MKLPEPVAWMFTNVQSGDIEVSANPDEKQDEREYWHSSPLFTEAQLCEALASQADELEQLQEQNTCLDNIASELQSTCGWQASKLAIHKLANTEPQSTFALYGGGSNKEIMRLSKDGVWVDPGLTTDEAAKAVIAALDTHHKHVFAKKDAAMRQALVALSDCRHGCEEPHNTTSAIKALEEALK